MASALGSPAGVDENRSQVGPRANRQAVAFSLVRRGLEFGIFGLILFVVLRTWSIEGLLVPFRVAGPSMANAFKGPHASVICEECAFLFHFAPLTVAENRPARCPNCGQQVDQETATARRGDQMWIDKCSLALRELRRWETVIFRCPQRSAQYCVKRVVGFPGEAIRITDGDVYVNEKIEQKTIHELRKMAIRVHDARYRRADGFAGRGWRRKEESGWHETADGFEFGTVPAPGTVSAPRTASTPATVSGEVPGTDGPDWLGPDWLGPDWLGPDWLWYEHQPYEGESPAVQGMPVTDEYVTDEYVTDEYVTDDYAYNPSLSRELNVVDDLLLSAWIEARGTGALYLRAVAHHAFVLQLNVAAGRGRLYAGDNLVEEFSFPQQLFSRRVLLEITTVDDQLQLAVDGAILLVHTDAGNRQPSLTAGREEGIPKLFQSNSAARKSQLAVGAINLEVKLANLQIYRDVYYSAIRPVDGSDGIRVLGKDEFFVLGDNSPMSLDSRQGKGSLVRREWLIGLPVGSP